MTEQNSAPAGLQVDPVRVINILKARLTEEVSKAAVLEAALQDAQERERRLAQALTEMQRQVQEAREADAADEASRAQPADGQLEANGSR